jgi:hypothetical protein
VPSINLTNNVGLNLSASSGDGFSTLERYLKNILTFKTPPSFDPLVNVPVESLQETSFPITISAAGQGQFAVEGTTLNIQAGPSASIGLLQDAAAALFLSALDIEDAAPTPSLVSFSLVGNVSLGDTAPLGQLTFDITNAATLTLTSYYKTAAGDTLGRAVLQAISALTIPHNLADLKSIPTGAICQLDATGSVQFTASATLTFLNDPLAALSLEKLPSFSIHASASATVETTVTHTSGHTLAIAKLPGNLLHLSLTLDNTGDFETSLTVSTGIAATIGGQDLLGFLLEDLNPGSSSLADSIAAAVPNAAQFKSGIKSAIDTALSSSLGASLKAALDRNTAKNRVFLFEIDLARAEADPAAESALLAALAGDFTALTKPGAAFPGIRSLDTLLTTTQTITHTFALHLLGIFNAASVHQFLAESSFRASTNTHELILADESIQVLDNNLDAEKLRKLLLRDITLTLPASANTPETNTPLTITYLDRQAAASRSQLQQFVNVLNFLNAPNPAAEALLNQNLPHYGLCCLALSLALTPAQCRRLYLDPGGQPRPWDFFVTEVCQAQTAILANQPENAYRLQVYATPLAKWTALREAGAAPNQTRILRSLGLSATNASLALNDVIPTIWWAAAMATYAQALADAKPLAKAAKAVLKDSNLGYGEPWMLLSAWNIAGHPPLTTVFTSSQIAPAKATGAGPA